MDTNLNPNLKPDRNENLIQFRLTPEELEEAKRMNLKGRAFVDYKEQKAQDKARIEALKELESAKKSNQSLNSPENTIQKRTNEPKDASEKKSYSPEYFSEFERRVKAEEQVKLAKSEFEKELMKLEQQIRSKDEKISELKIQLDKYEDPNKPISKGELNGFLAIELKKIREEEERQRLVKSEAELKEKVSEQEKEIERLEDELESMASEINGLEMAQKAIPELAKIWHGFRTKGMDGGLAQIGGLNSDQQPGQQQLPAPQLDEETKEKIKFYDEFTALFSNKDVMMGSIEICSFIGKRPEYLQKVIDFVFEEIRKEEEQQKTSQANESDNKQE